MAKDTDIFDYRSVKDSTVSLSGRDLIGDFEDGADFIRFARLGLVNNDFRGIDQQFTGTPNDAETRVITTAAGWTIQVDTNGDRKVDMAIDVADSDHSIIWNAADFIF
ncbi:MAG: hypothetical protein U1E15_06335 [Hyphomicrobiales bacterium]